MYRFLLSVFSGGLLLLTGGCSTTHIASGQLSTHNGVPLALSSDQIIAPGEAKVSFSTSSGLGSKFEVESKGGKLSVPVYSSYYSENSLLIPTNESGLSAAIKGVWYAQVLDRFTRMEEGTCTTSGHCYQSVAVVRCSNGRVYEEGDSGYDQAKQSDKCSKSSQSKRQFSSTCPGYVALQNEYEVLKYALHVDFLAPHPASHNLATFQGETGTMERRSRSTPVSLCRILH
jgi:hypothetical protein